MQDQPERPERTIDEALALVVTQGRRRRRTRQQRLVGSGAGMLAVVAIAALLTVPGDDGPRGRLTGGAVDDVALARPELSTPITDPLTTPSSAVPATTPPAPAGPPPPFALVKVSSKAELLARIKREALKVVEPWGLPQYASGAAQDGRTTRPVPGPPATMAPAAPGEPAPATGQEGSADTSYSQTNVQEAGVDEPDIAKTNGRIVVSVSEGKLHIVDPTGSTRLLGSLAFPATTYPTSLFLVGDQAMVFLSGADTERNVMTTTAAIVDLTNLSAPRIVRQHKMDGALASARLIDGKARVVLTHGPLLTFTSPDGSSNSESRALAENKQRIQASGFEDWVAPGTGCGDAYQTQSESGLATLAVRTIDPQAAAPGPGVCVLSAAETVYASPTSLYVATTQIEALEARAEQTAPPSPPTTSVHRFDITNADVATYVGSGEVEGTVLNQFSLSEHNGDLRIATTRGFGNEGADSQVTVLRPAGDRLSEIGALRGLAKNERITGVRFVGELAYVVTFVQEFCDPLFVIDLRDPTRPALRGALEVRGLSSYLHPTENAGRIIGVGRDDDQTAGPCTTRSPQLSLFDVANPDSPRLLHRAVLDQGQSEAELDHHAFLYWPATDLVVLPVTLWPEGQEQFAGAIGFRVSDAGITEVGRITHPTSDYPRPVRRAFVIGDRVVTVSEAGVGANDLTTLAGRGFSAY